MLTNEQKRKVESNIKRLDYLEGTGVVSNNRKHLAHELFIFISAGGTGHRALARLKQTMVNQVDSHDVENQTMFLAIDTDLKELNKCVSEEKFTANEILKIPYEGAHDSINPQRILPQLAAWVHKDLWAATGGGAAVSKEFNGTGAGAKRQCGRVLLAQSAVQAELNKKLSNITKISARMGNADRIQVFFLAGIAGGTGSGTILDLAFLSRHFLKGILGPAYKKVTFSAYLFLPSACGDKDAVEIEKVANGNRNAYAALKEIDHYMTMTNRHEHFVMNYGTVAASTIDIADNVFDFCTLVEGIGDNGQFFESNAETSRQIVADSILNIVCADNAQTGANNQPVYLVDSFLSNMGAQTNVRIELHSDKVWPRDTNYLYSVIGYSSCVVPIDLLTVYVVKKIFDEVFKRFRRADDANEDNASVFIESCGLDIGSLSKRYKILSKEQLLKDIQNQADEEFKANGPYYMVNLTKKAVDLINSSPNDYLHKAIDKQNGFFADKDKWIMIQRIYHTAAEYISKINHELYDVYTYAITVLKELMEKNAKLLTETKEYQNSFGKSFYWSPIDLTPGDQATIAVAEYLDDMLDQKAIREKAELFIEALSNKKDEWTGINRKDGHGIITFNVAKAVREFISENLQSCVNTTLEEFLVKAYSGRKDAPVYEYDPVNGREICSTETKIAAENILNRLSGSASALAPTNDFSLSECYSNIYLTLPDNCPWLFDAITDLADTFGIDRSNIFRSSAKDSVVFCRLYAGVPAWALFWTANAEENYEGNDGKGTETIGLHMDQGDHGTNWAELPNLYPEKLWSPIQRSVRKREANIASNVRYAMEKAKSLGLLVKNNNDSKYYDAFLLDMNAQIDKSREWIQLDLKKKYELDEIIQMLFQQNKLSRFKVDFANMVMSTTDAMDTDQEEQFYFDLSCRIMRRRWNEYKRLEVTLEVVEMLKEQMDTHNASVVDTSVLGLFVRCLKWDVLVYDGRRNMWKGQLKTEIAIGSSLNDKFQQICAHYYGFCAFSALNHAVKEEFSKCIDNIEETATDKQFDEAENAVAELKASLITLKDAKKNTVRPWPDQSPFKCGNESPWPMASLDFVDKAGSENAAAAIRTFYVELVNNL